MSYYKEKFLSKSFQESVWNLLASILFVYVSGVGILLTTWLNTSKWEWSVLIITTVVSVIPVVKSWISRNANIQMDALRAENLTDLKAAQEEKEKLNADWQLRFDKLKDENDALKIDKHMLQYDLEQAIKQLKKLIPVETEP